MQRKCDAMYHRAPEWVPSRVCTTRQRSRIRPTPMTTFLGAGKGAHRLWQFRIRQPAQCRARRCAFLNRHTLDRLPWRRKRDTITVGQHQRFIQVWNMGMHNWAVSVALNICFEALDWIAPTSITLFGAGHKPTVVTVKALPCTNGCLMRCKVHKCVAQTRTSFKIYREVHEIVAAT